MKLKVISIIFFMMLSEVMLADEVVRHEKVLIIANPIAADEIDTEFQTGHVTVINRDEFEGELSTVADVLKKQTGVQIRRSGGAGSYSTVNIRGASGAQVNVFLDGILLNGAFGGTVDLSQFLLGSVESIQIYRGNVPVQFGASSIGGAINIKSLSSIEKDSKQISAGYGSFDTRRLAATIIEQEKNYDVLFSGESLSSDNDYELINENGTYEYSSDDTQEKRNNADFEHFAGMLSGEYRVDEKLSLQALLQGYYKEQGLSELQNSPFTRSQIDTEFLTGQVKMNLWSSANTSYVFKLFSSEKVERYKDLQSRIGTKANNEKGVTTNLGLGLQASTNYYSHLFSFNIESKSEEYNQNDYADKVKNEYSRLNTTLGIQDDWVSGSGNHMLMLGIKTQYIEDDNGSLGNENSDFYANYYSGYRFQINQNWLFQTNLAREVRIPLLNEKFGDRGSTTGTEELKPETAINTDIGIKYSKNNFSISSAYFYRYLDDAIVLVFSAQGVGKPENISKADIHGFELESTFDVNTNFSVLFNATMQHSEDLSSSSSSAGKLLPGLYKREAFFAGDYRYKSYSFSFEYEYQTGGFYDSSNVSTAQLPTTKQINLMAKWEVPSHRVELIVDNLTDQKVQDFNRYPSPGRTLSVSYTYNF